MRNKIVSLLLGSLLVINIFGQDKQKYSHLAAVLDSIYTADQSFQKQYVDIYNRYGRESDELKSLLEKMRESYSKNLTIVVKILDEYGWLGEENIGHRGNMALFLVIQHSGIDAQSKYLPVMRDAVRKGNASPANLALLEDRVALRQGRRQIYGTQLAFDEKTNEAYIEPLEDPDNVDKRRAEMGLEPLQDYLSGSGMKWDPEEYKKKLPAIEAKYRREIIK
jgi:hypothetical protein